jgi:hypothetical protein
MVLGWPLPKLCPVILTSNQDGHQAKNRKRGWKGTTKGSFQQSLVEIGSVVSEEKIFFLNFIPPFSIFSLVAICFSISQNELKF